jgi:hypothetical protein
MPDPLNVIQNRRAVGQPQSVTGTKTTRPSATGEKFLRMMRDCLTIQELGLSHNANRLIRDSFGSMDNALNYFMDNFVIMGKTEIAGISGHICNNCLSFQFRYIRDIGFDFTAREKHRCLPSMVNEASKLQNKFARLEHLRMQAYDSLTMLTNSIFMGNRHLAVNSTFTPPYVTNPHLPLIKFDSITPIDWAWTPISTKAIALTDIGLKNYIIQMEGSTYAQIFVKSGVYPGYHLMYIKVEQ